MQVEKIWWIVTAVELLRDWVKLFVGAVLGAVLWGAITGATVSPERFTEAEAWFIIVVCGIYLLLFNALLLVMELLEVGFERLTGQPRPVDNRPVEPV